MKNTIKSRRDFNFEDSEKSVVMPAFIVKWRSKKRDTAEYGLIASKKTFPTAVARNRAKRLLRAWIAQTGLPNGFDILFIAKRQILETNLGDGLKQTKNAFKKIA